jgi:hypothetical protein
LRLFCGLRHFGGGGDGGVSADEDVGGANKEQKKVTDKLLITITC